MAKKSFITNTAASAFPEAGIDTKSRTGEVKSMRISFAISPSDYTKLKIVAANMTNQTGKRHTANSIFSDLLAAFLAEHENDLDYKEIFHDSEGNAVEK